MGGDVRVTMTHHELSALRDGRGSPVGMNFPGYGNRQFALNVMHWLSRLL